MFVLPKWFKRGLSRETGPGKEEVLEFLRKHVSMQFVRASGAGGQNVNKISTAVVAKLDLASPEVRDFLGEEVKERLRSGEAGRVSKKGELIFKSEEERYQQLNKSAVLNKFYESIDKALKAPKVRQAWTSIGQPGKEIRKEMKKHRKEIKAGRTRNVEE